jgi:TolB-like protein
MSADPANEYFSDGLTETLLHMLAQIADLKVAARTSAFAFKDKNIDVRAIATELGVAHILEGSVQKLNNRVRITAQLIRAEDGYQVWSKHYDRTLDDVFAIQDEIALSVSSSLGSTLLAGSDGDVVGVFTENIDAYDIYLRALEQLALGTIESFGAAEELFAQALVVDPSFIDAKIGLVQSNFLRYSKGTGEFETTSVTSARLLSEVIRPKASRRYREPGNGRGLLSRLDG